jgi:hypothetical protein
MSETSTFNPVAAIYSDERFPDWEAKGAAVLHLLEPMDGMDPIVDVAPERSGLAASIKNLQKGVRIGIHYITPKSAVAFVA